MTDVKTWAERIKEHARAVLVSDPDRETTVCLERITKFANEIIEVSAIEQSKLDHARAMLTLVYTAGADGEGMKSCCDGKHFSTTLMAGDRVYRFSYADTDAFDKLSGPVTRAPDTHVRIKPELSAVAHQKRGEQ